MPLKLNDDGEITDEWTGRARELEPRGRANDIETDVSDRPRPTDLVRPTDVRDGIPTERRGGSPEAGRYGARPGPIRDRPGEGDGKTHVYRGRPPDPGGLDDTIADPPTHDVEAGEDAMSDPPVGWLTIIAGPGKGRVATLGVGANSIGRGRTARVSLDYGDEMMSRTNHGAITYEPRRRKFYIQPGGGTNLTYVNDEPVLQARELESSMQVQMGNTVLRFVPLCGAEFSWDDESGSD